MVKPCANRFAVLSSGLVVPRLEDMERDFINAWIRMKGNLALGSSPPKLSYQQEKQVKNLASDAHRRRFRQAGLSALDKRRELRSQPWHLLALRGLSLPL